MTKSWRIDYRDGGREGDRDSVVLAAPPGLVKTKAETELDSVSITLQHEKEVAAKNKHCMALATGSWKVSTADGLHAVDVRYLNPDLFHLYNRQRAHESA